MMLMQVMGSHPQFEQEIMYGIGAQHLKGKVANTAEFFGRSVSAGVGQLIVAAVELGAECNPVSLVEKYTPDAGQVANAGRYLKSAASKGVQALDQVNPVSIAIRNGPWYISQPLQFTRDELTALATYLSHPVSSAQEMLEYFSKKPSRLAKLLRAGGVNIPTDVMAAMKMEEDWDKAQELLPIFIEKGIDPLKILNKDMARLRGKVVLSIIKTCMGDDTELFQSLERLAIGLLETAGTRVVAKTLKVAEKDKPVERPVQNKVESPADSDAEELFFDALESLAL